MRGSMRGMRLPIGARAMQHASMMLQLESYEAQKKRWPQKGRVILAQYDDASIVVYQAYRASIARFAVEHQHFGGDFSFARMSWVKPNFMWMMYRSSWGTADGQEHVLALRIKRAVFESWLTDAVASSFGQVDMPSREEWQQAVKTSHVRLQWDPDHGPSGGPLERRAIQLGLRGPALAGFAGDALLGIEDISEFVAEQRALRGDIAKLMTPLEREFPLSPEARARVGMSQ